MTTRARMAMTYTSDDGFMIEKLDEVFIQKTYWTPVMGTTVEVADIIRKVDLHGKEYQMEFKAVPMQAILPIPEPVKAKDTL